MQSITLPSRFDDHENVNNFCPSCGALNIGPTTSFEFEPCQHTLFYYINLAGEVTYIREDIAPLLQAALNEDDGENEVEKLLELEIDNAFVIIESGAGFGDFTYIGYEYSALDS